MDFEQPRALWQKVFSDTDREHYVSNVSGHIGGVKNKAIIERQCKVRSLCLATLKLSKHLLLVRVFAAVDQDLSDRIAKAVGHPTVKPLEVKPASEAVRFKINEL